MKIGRFSAVIVAMGVGAAVSIEGGLARPIGRIDVNRLVTNPHSRTLRISQESGYVSQKSFDFNGDWDGVTTDGSDTLVRFTIRNDLLVSASCQSDVNSRVVVLSTAVMNGEFSANAYDDFAFSGSIVSASQAVGRIAAPQCLGDSHPWRAAKLGSLLKTAFLSNAD